MGLKARAFPRRGNVFRFALALIALAPAAAEAQAIRVTDDLGKLFAFSAPPRRIISLAPNITEILFALGLDDQIIGVTRYCDFPPSAEAKTKIGGLLDPNIEKIQSLAPDLVIAFRGNPLSALRKLEELRLPVFTLDIGAGLEAVPPTIAKIGAVTGRVPEADQLLAGLAEKLGRIDAALAPVRSYPRVFLSLQGLGLWTFGRDSYFTDLLTRAKAASVTAAIPKSWLEYGRESLIEADPDAIIILAKSEADFRNAADWYRAQAGLNNLRAVRENRFLFLDQNAASRFGPRLYDTVADLARLLHPERFPAR